MSHVSSVNSSSAASELLARHRETLDRALAAIRDRGYWTPYPESPKAYGDAQQGKDAFAAYLGKPFPLEQPGTDSWVGGERSPYGVSLGVTYPHPDVDVLFRAMQAALPAWRDAGADVRAGVCLEILHRINQRSHEIAWAVMHTSGQAFGMAFQAGGPHAQDRGLEAVAYAYAEMTRHPAAATWEKPQGKKPPLRMIKRFHVVPRGLALVIGCNTFPTWNGYPGLFASLATGNPVVVKPHPNATLPLAITVRIAREVLAEAGFSPDLVALAAEAPGEGLAKTLALRPEVRIIDYTGSTAFGDWLEEHARQAVVFTEKAGVNPVVVDSTDDYQGMLANLAFSLSLYSGQMCTTPQNILLPRDGITANGERRSFDEVARDLAAAVAGLLGDDARAAAILGAIVNDGVRERLERAASGELGEVVLASRRIQHPEYPDAEVRTPVIVKLDVADEDVYRGEHFGPIAFLIATDSTEQAIGLFRDTVRDCGAITASVYSTDEKVLQAAEEAAVEAGVALSCNLTQGVYVNQSTAFSDFHATGANPAANAALTDGAFVASRFRVVQSRRHLPAEG
ncbi:Aldehyde dehydrogenase [Carbonactinospora thermoautotrophica]|uniref:Aldehyde dehydrogenase n=1 Tax=Carbonactinospora thermoautotrophica TaxID=1469144 RepID=A0A132MMU6_9ACTN|nr:phenylacetic acid degradation protein PaaN [Carbonactinospora thermoautotrophica]KWW99176.1 Aldehyde dehydrogenase [Carbonactinospora thermoautotrophica]